MCHSRQMVSWFQIIRQGILNKWSYCLIKDFAQKLESCEDVRDQYEMLLELLHKAIDVPKKSLPRQNRSQVWKAILDTSTMSEVRQKHRLRKLYLQTHYMNIYDKFVKLLIKSSKNIEKIFVLILKIILKKLEECY